MGKSHLGFVVDNSEAICRHPQHGTHRLSSSLETRQEMRVRKRSDVGKDKSSFLTEVLLSQNVSGHTQTHL